MEEAPEEPPKEEEEEVLDTEPPAEDSAPTSKEPIPNEEPAPTENTAAPVEDIEPPIQTRPIGPVYSSEPQMYPSIPPPYHTCDRVYKSTYSDIYKSCSATTIDSMQPEPIRMLRRGPKPPTPPTEPKPATPPQTPPQEVPHETIKMLKNANIFW